MFVAGKLDSIGRAQRQVLLARLDSWRRLLESYDDSCVYHEQSTPPPPPPPGGEPPTPPTAAVRGYAEPPTSGWFNQQAKGRPTRAEAMLAAALLVHVHEPEQLAELQRAVASERAACNRDGDSWVPPRDGDWAPLIMEAG